MFARRAGPFPQLTRADVPHASRLEDDFIAKSCCAGLRASPRRLSNSASARETAWECSRPNCPEWHIADFAIQGIGGVTVPVYFHESADRITYILKDSGARVVFTSGEEQARKIAECRPNLPELEQVISVAPPADLHGESLRYDALIAATGDAEIQEYRRRAAE